jgi:hypothetical protein
MILAVAACSDGSPNELTRQKTPTGAPDVGGDASANPNPNPNDANDSGVLPHNDSGTPPPVDGGSDAGSDAGNDAGTGVNCATPGVLLCDDFEGAPLSATWTTKLTGTGSSLVVDTARPHRGTKSLHIALPEDGNPADATKYAAGALLRRTGSPFPLQKFYGRLYMYAVAPVPTLHNYMVDAAGMLNGSLAHYHWESKTGKLGSLYFNKGLIAGEGTVGKTSPTPTPTDRWLCVEWLFDGPKNAMQFWFDGTEDTTIRVDGTENPVWKAPPAFESIDIGWFHHQQGAPGGSEVYYDDIVLANNRIGCLP